MKYAFLLGMVFSTSLTAGAHAQDVTPMSHAIITSANFSNDLNESRSNGSGQIGEVNQVAQAVVSDPAPDSATAADGAPSGQKSADEIARELANPNNSLASLTFKNQYRWYEGELPNADDQDNYTLLFQPAFPFPLEPTTSGGKPNIFVRPAFPLLVNQPAFDSSQSDFDGVTGLGDIGFDLAYGVTEPNGMLWALGMVGTLPTATDSALAGKQLRLGPEALIAQFEDWGVYGIFPSHQWDVAGWSNSSYSTTQVQGFLRFLPGGGWNVGSSPIMDYDWETEEWTIPLSVSVSKTVTMGGTPVKLEFEVNYYVSQPDAFGPDWLISFNVTPVVNNFINQWIQGP